MTPRQPPAAPSHPEDGRLFLISDRHGEALGEEYTSWATLHLTLCLIGICAAAFLWITLKAGTA